MSTERIKKKPGKARMTRELGLQKKRREAIAPASVPEGVQLGRVRVVLVSPSGAPNIGQCARAMLNMGLTRLYLVNPTAKWRSSQSRQMAVGAAWELIKNARVFDTLPEALEGCAYTVAMTAGTGRVRAKVRNFEDVLPKIGDGTLSGDVALVFGTEVHGLTNDEIALCHEPARLPVSETYSSLNLSQAVLLSSAQLFAYKRPFERAGVPELAAHEDLEGFYAQLRRILDRTAFLPKQNPDLLFNQIRALFGKASLEAREVKILRGILSHFEWNLDNPDKINPK